MTRTWSRTQRPARFAAGARSAERVVEHEPPVAEDEVGHLVRPLQRARVVRDVVVGRDGEQDDVGRVGPDLPAEREEFLRRAVAGDAEVDDLDRAAIERAAAAQVALHHRPEGRLLRDLQSLRV
jgi:hypothetical protein